MELIIHNGKSYWVPAAASETVSINNFSKWEQAFCVFSNIYTRGNPDRAGELIQYNHVIHSIFSSYTWDNVYAYDKEFRLHLGKHPHRSWAIILQQAWLMKLCDHINQRHDSSTPNHHSGQSTWVGNNYNNHQSGGTWHRSRSSSPCQRYNKGKCNLGKDCKYDHRCTYFNKFGHGVIVCCKLIFDKEKGGRKDGGNTSSPERN